MSAGLLGLFLLAAAPSPPVPEPRIGLVVMLTVDQLGAHTFQRYLEALPPGGIKRLMQQGAYYPRARFAYANTETGPGHATLATGAWPNVHGIVGNVWYDPKSGAEQNCVGDPEYGKSPRFLEVPNLADTLKVATRGEAKVVSISLKDRAAILIAGRGPTLAAWYEEKQGRFVAGRWPGHGPIPGWFSGAALELGPKVAFGRPWARLRDQAFYSKYAGPDDLPTEEDVPGLGRTFPRTMGQGLEATDPVWWDRYRGSPAAIEDLFTLAEQALEQEHLGRRGVPDLLAIGVSPIDYAGHAYGTHSQEMLDLLLRVDRQVARLLDRLDRVLAGRVLYVLTADHGAMPTPEEAAKLGVRALRIPPRPLIEAADRALGDQKVPALERSRVLELDQPRIFLAPTDPKVDRNVLAQRVVAALVGLPGVVEAHPSAEVEAFEEPYRTFFRRSYFPGRTGDVLIRHRAYEFLDGVGPDGIGVGTGHGSPYAYDMDVPLILAGPRVRRGWDPRPVEETQVAPTIAALLGIDAPAAANDPPLPAIVP